MTTTYKICLLAGDGIGPEIIAEGVKVLNAVGAKYDTAFEYTDALIGGAAIDATGEPLPTATLDAAVLPTRCCWLPWAALSGTPPILPPRVRSRGSWASVRSWACTPTCVPCRSSTLWPTPPRCARRSSTAWT